MASFFDRNRTRLKLWLILIAGLIASVTILIAVRRDDDAGAGRPPAAIRLRIVDEAGVPLKDAVAFIRRLDGEPTSAAARFDPATAHLGLGAADEGATVVIGAPGCRVARIEDVRTDRTVVLEKGHAVRLRMAGDAPPLDPPLVGLFRVRPTGATASLGEGAGTRPLDLSELMQLLHRTRKNAMQLPTEKFGFAVSEDDAASGFRVPVAGTYEVVWGMLDEGPGTWFRLEDGPMVTIEVKDTAEAQAFDVAVSRPVWNRTRLGLKERVEREAVPGR